MAAPSFSLFTWATSGTPAASVLTSGLQTNGWADFDHPTAAQHNRQLYELTQYVTWLTDEAGTPFAFEHYPTADTDALGNAIPAGVHKDITCDSIEVRALGNGAGEGGTLSFPQAGSASDNRALISLGALGSGDCILKLDHPGTDAIELELGGGVFRSTLAAGASWTVEVDSGSDQTLLVRNIGAGNANLDVDGNTNLQGTLDVGSTADVVGLVTAQAGAEVTGKDATSDIRYGYGSSGVTISYDMSPYNGGYTVIDAVVSGNTNMVPSFSPAANPPDVTTGTTGSDLFRLRRPLPGVAENITDGHGAATLYRVVGLGLRYERTNAAVTMAIEIIRTARDGSGASSTILSWTQASELTTVGSGFTLYSDNTLTLDLDPSTYSYALEVRSTAGGGGSGSIADVYLRMRKLGVE